MRRRAAWGHSRAGFGIGEQTGYGFGDAGFVPTGTTRPWTPESINWTLPGISVTTDGRPAAMASDSEHGNPSFETPGRKIGGPQPVTDGRGRLPPHEADVRGEAQLGGAGFEFLAAGPHRRSE